MGGVERLGVGMVRGEVGGSRKARGIQLGSHHHGSGMCLGLGVVRRV